PDCSNLEPNTKYCVIGFVEPLRSTDGFCGPQHNNATCLGTEAQCCNAETWTCGNTEEDCANGTCYEGDCFGDKEYSTDGTCGWQHGRRKCAGKWGDCCHHDGTCGTGTAFCAKGNCQSGNCDWDAIFATTSAPASSSSTTTTATSSSSSTTTTDPSAWPTFTITDCVGGTGTDKTSNVLCDLTCRRGFCPLLEQLIWAPERRAPERRAPERRAWLANHGMAFDSLRLTTSSSSVIMKSFLV
ncbi:hypothetical protein C8A05DRAFT_14823, partial [Staphylotrichum tortipilum]